MAASAFINHARMSVSGAPGTGSITLGSAVTRFASMAEAGAVDATKYTYLIEDGDDFEIGQGTYTASGTSFSRDTVYLSKIAGVSGATKLTLTSAAIVSITIGKEDLPASAIVGTTDAQTLTNKTLTTPLITGITDGSDAASGNDGEHMFANVLVASAVSLTTNVVANLTSITLTPGDWEVNGSSYYSLGATTNITNYSSAISTISATNPTIAGTGPWARIQVPANVPGAITVGLNAGSWRFNVTMNTTIYLIAQANFTVSTCVAYGYIKARRIR